jgi:hypothetical protein
MRKLTSLGLIRSTKALRPVLEMPELSELPHVEKLLDHERILPHKMRKGKSGERNNNGGKQRRG